LLERLGELCGWHGAVSGAVPLIVDARRSEDGKRAGFRLPRASDRLRPVL
jgi:hypothetical protein